MIEDGSIGAGVYLNFNDFIFNRNVKLTGSKSTLSMSLMIVK